MKTFRPLIAVSARASDSLPGNSELYLNALERAGGEGVFIYPGDDEGKQAATCDGVVIPGGRDITPSYYHEKRTAPLSQEDSARVDFEFSLLHEIMGRRKPILGICYGMQLLNVFFKGTLYQDLVSQRTGALDHRDCVHSVTIGDNPFLKKGAYNTNSYHHQAVKEAGRGIRPFAYAPDGVIEAFCHEDYDFMLGVQWHPERMDNALTEDIFGRFVEACVAGK